MKTFDGGYVSRSAQAWRRVHAITGHRVPAYEVDITSPGMALEFYDCKRCQLLYVLHVPLAGRDHSDGS